MIPSQKKPVGPKLFLSLGLIIASGAYALWQNMSGANQSALTTTTPPQDQQPTSIQITPSQPTPVPAPVPGQMMRGGSMMRSGLYADGSYTGSAADAYYGTVQVKAVIAGGKITDVQFLQYPNDRGTSREINNQAMPMLAQEAIRAQNANVNGVSGATETSGAFRESLTAALALAKN